jgi:hypothetical protein
MAVTDADGRFEIRNLPAGKHSFRLYHESAGYVQRAKRDGVEQRWPNGKLPVAIPADDTLDLGDLLISPKLLHHDE